MDMVQVKLVFDLAELKQQVTALQARLDVLAAQGHVHDVPAEQPEATDSAQDAPVPPVQPEAAESAAEGAQTPPAPPKRRLFDLSTRRAERK